MRAERTLTAAALLCRTLVWFPVWLLVLSVQQNSLQNLLICCGILLCTALPTACIARSLRTQRRARTVRLMLWLIPVICAAAWMIARTTGSPFTGLLLSAVTLITAAGGPQKAPEELFALPAYTAFLTLIVLAALMLRIAAVPVRMAAVLPVVCIESCGFFLLRNQFMLRRMVNRRSSIPCDVPQSIRRGNLLLVLGAALLPILLLLLRKPFAAMMTWMQTAAFQLAQWLLRSASRLTQTLGDSAPAEIIEEGETAAQSYGEGSPLWLLLWIPMIAVIFVFWRAFLTGWCDDLRDAVRRLIARLRGRPAAGFTRYSSVADYTDTETVDRTQPLTQRRQHRSWLRQLRAWRSQPDTTEKFYAGYQLLLTAPAWQSHTPHASDTVQEIRDAWSRLHLPEAAGELDAVTADFHADRYAEQEMPQSAIADMETALRALAKYKP